MLLCDYTARFGLVFVGFYCTPIQNNAKDAFANVRDGGQELYEKQMSA